MKKLVVFNHKMYLDFNNVKEYINGIKDNLRTDIDIVVCPSSIYMPFFRGKYDFKLGSQNIAGCFSTGEVSGEQLKSLDVTHVLVGHSERRQNFNESNKMINLKIKDALDNNITPILCVGETIEERSLRKTQDVILKQIREALRGIEVLPDIVIAYEPVWAIGSGITPTAKEITEVVEMIKNAVYRAHNINIRVLYGGSVNEKNVPALNKIKELDGYLIGKASIYPDRALEIINEVE